MTHSSHPGLAIKASDLYYKYQRKKATRDRAKFRGKPDSHPFDRDDLYEVLPMLEMVMAELKSDDGRVLQQVEELMIGELPVFIRTREEVFDCLVGVMRERLED